MNDRVLAIVEDTKITEDDLEAVIMKYPENKREHLKKEIGRKNLLEQIINSELLYYYGKEMEIDKTEEFKARIEQYSKELVIQTMMDKIVQDINISEDKAEEYYLSNKEEFIDPEKVAAKHILVETKEEALKIKKDIEEEVISFEDAAMKYSMCPSCMQGGSIGSFPRGKMYPEIDEAAFSAEINIITEPVKTEMGYHLILVEDKQEERMRGFEEVKTALIKKLTKDEEHKKFMECIESLQNKFCVSKLF